MKKFSSLLNSRSGSTNSRSKSSDDIPISQGSPEAAAATGVRAFCESGGPNNSGDEVTHLPAIVDAAESSPLAAKEAAYTIRKMLGKENYTRGYVQYNAIMLIRILADNPGQSFTTNLDGKFVTVTKDLLRDGKDLSVQQILRETLDSFEAEKSHDETLQPLLALWKIEKARSAKKLGPISHRANGANFGQQHPNAWGQRAPSSLPSPHELASRIEEAKTSAKLLLQVVQTTPTAQVYSNDLIKEFADRCQSASKSIQNYMNCQNPAPDDDTLLTLIETNDQLSHALSRHQRALLQARKQFANQRNAGHSPSNPSSPPVPPPRSEGRINEGGLPGPPPGPPPNQMTQGPPLPPTGSGRRPSVPPQLSQPSPGARLENPFADSNSMPSLQTTAPPSQNSQSRSNETSRFSAISGPISHSSYSRTDSVASDVSASSSMPPAVTTPAAGSAGDPLVVRTNEEQARGVNPAAHTLQAQRNFHDDDDDDSDAETPAESRNVQYRF
ncbi:hypothetical protein MMC25_005198 [Agyrium rufum]|nr:hypothetical protein [Agyrium rufum]